MRLHIFNRIALISSFIAASETFQTSFQKASRFQKISNKEKNYDSKSFILLNHREDCSLEVEQRNDASIDGTLDLLPSPLSSDSNKDDDIFRTIRQNTPLWVQNSLMRDSGFVRFCSDTLIIFGLPTIISTHVQALPNFLALTDVPVWLRRHIYSLLKMNDVLEKEPFVRENTFESVQYGDHPMQVAHLMRPLVFEKGDTSTHGRDRLVVFIHGGAWGSGRPWMYRLVARPLIQLNYSVAVIGYRTYPDSDTYGQVDDVKLATEKLLQHSPEFAKNDVTIMGHSSGSNIGLLSILDEHFLQRIKIGAFISLSAVFDVVKHYEFETGRGVEEISPMKPACGGSELSFRRCSPTHQVHDFVRKHGSDLLPKMLLLHGILDDTVPYTSTTDLSEELRKGIVDKPSEKQRFKTLILPKIGHADTVVQFMMGGETRDHVLSWLSVDE